MKKIISLALSVVLLLSAMSCINIVAYANTQKSSTPITTGEIKDGSIKSTSNKAAHYWFTYQCTVNGYYEYSMTSSSAPKDDIAITLFDSSNNVVSKANNNTGSKAYKAIFYLEAGKKYYIRNSLAGYTYNFKASITYHVHNNLYTKTIKAIADDDKENRLNGEQSLSCKTCGYSYSSTTIYAPKTVVREYKSAIANGSELQPIISVKDAKGNLVSSTEYNVSYENNTKPGLAYIYIDFIGNNYEGQITSSFIIKPAKMSAVSLSSSKKNEMVFKWKKDTTVDGYEYQYSTSKKFANKKTATITLDSKNKSSAKITKLIANKKYYVRIRAYKTINNVKYYGSWSNKLSVKVKK